VWLGAVSVVAGCEEHRAVHIVQFTPCSSHHAAHKKSLDQTVALNLLRKMTYILRLLTIRLILIEVQNYKQNVYTPLDRSTAATQQ